HPYRAGFPISPRVSMFRVGCPRQRCRASCIPGVRGWLVEQATRKDSHARKSQRTGAASPLRGTLVTPLAPRGGSTIAGELKQTCLQFCGGSGPILVRERCERCNRCPGYAASVVAARSKNSQIQE